MIFAALSNCSTCSRRSPRYSLWLQSNRFCKCAFENLQVLLLRGVYNSVCVCSIDRFDTAASEWASERASALILSRPRGVLERGISIRSQAAPKFARPGPVSCFCTHTLDHRLFSLHARANYAYARILPAAESGEHTWDGHFLAP